MHIFNYQQKPHLILSGSELLFRESPLDQELIRHRFDAIKKISLEHRFDKSNTAYVWLKVWMKTGAHPFHIQISHLDESLEDVLGILLRDLQPHGLLTAKSVTKILTMHRQRKRTKGILLTFAGFLVTLFLTHHFLVPDLQSLPAGGVKSSLFPPQGICTTRAKAAFVQAGAKDALQVKSYCGMFNLWIEEQSKSVPKAYLETEFSELSTVDYIQKASEALKKNAHKEVYHHLDQALYITPNHEQANLFYALMLTQEQRYDEAKTMLNKVITEHPDSATAYLRLGQLYAIDKDFNGAYPLLKKAVQLQPQATTLALLASVESKLEKTDDAILNFERALYEDNNNTAYLTSLGLLYWKKADYQKTATILEKTYRLSPNDPITFLNLYEINLVTKTGLSVDDLNHFVQTFGEQPEQMQRFEMLRIISESMAGQDVDKALQTWQLSYKDQALDWSFDELFDWLDHNENLTLDEKQSIQSTLRFFVGFQQAYKLSHQGASETLKASTLNFLDDGDQQ